MELLVEKDSQKENIISIVEPESFCISMEANTKNELTFTLSNMDKITALLTDIESVIWFNGQKYIVKQLGQEFVNGKQKNTVTATHYFFEAQNYRTYQYQEGKKTYRINQLCDHYFKGNEGGFTYQIHGNFPKVEIENLEHGSIKDGVNKVLEKYPDTYLKMDNTVVHFYTKNQWIRKQQRVIHYYHDSQNVKLELQSTELVNIVKCFGGKDDKGKELFAPFFVQDNQSIKAWGKRYGEDVSDERFKHKNELENYAKTKLIPNPKLVLTINSPMLDTLPELGNQYPFVLHINDYQTEVTLMGIRWYPLATYKVAELTFNDLNASFFNYQSAVKKEVQQVKNKQKETSKITEQVKTIDSKVSELVETAKNTEKKAQQALNGQIFGKVVKNVENH
ncbi:phage tail protein [Melissococcus plutonius]|uniref:prophage endopeptidase tail family protein n=8 Tax=Melissococcus plutonius TaxID=33970 RepID=UPI0021E54EE9|nr:prophage endopeptidase tail family protein [Melissococcus plutonius]MCV2520645.1 phage tail protein [Melissococcus plutonius]